MTEAVNELSAEVGIIYFKAFGVPMWMATNRLEARERLLEVLPPHWEHSEEVPKHKLGIIGDSRGTYAVDLGGVYLIEGVSLDLAIETMNGVVRSRVAQDAPERIFIHAGVVGYDGQAIVLPGHSFAGKTTLVAALVRAGAVYYSDEFAPIDADGIVHPYAKPLSLRGDDQRQTDHSAESLGGTVGQDPLPVGAVVVTNYRPGAKWDPQPLPEGRGALALLSHTVPARDRPEQSLQAIRRAVEGAVLLEGERGDAEELVPTLMAQLERRPA
jgi:hypothetical protein